MTKAILPSLTSRDAYHQCFRDEQVWRPAIAAICQRHHLSSEPAVRALHGTHIVFFTDDQLVIKLFSPLFHSDYQAESVALRLLANRLPVRTPDIAFEGELEGWPYLIMQRLGGELLVDCMHTMTPGERLAIAAQVGELAAALHRIPVDGASSLRSDWSAFLRRQQAQLTSKHAKSGLPPSWVDEIAAFVGALEPLEAWPVREALLHCDLHGDHLLVDRSSSERPRLVGLFDFGDALIGAHEYEFAAVATFLFCGSQETTREFFRAYGYRSDDLTASLRARLTGYVLLHRYGPLPLFLPRFPEPRPQSVGELHELLWGF